MDDYIVVSCPHCKEVILIYKQEIRCAIFRHAVCKDTMKQIDPHSPKHVCDEFVRQEKVYGCSKPFRLERKEKDEWEAVECGYI